VRVSSRAETFWVIEASAASPALLSIRSCGVFVGTRRLCACLYECKLYLTESRLPSPEPTFQFGKSCAHVDDLIARRVSTYF